MDQSEQPTEARPASPYNPLPDSVGSRVSGAAFKPVPSVATAGDDVFAYTCSPATIGGVQAFGIAMAVSSFSDLYLVANVHGNSKALYRHMAWHISASLSRWEASLSCISCPNEHDLDAGKGSRRSENFNPSSFCCYRHANREEKGKETYKSKPSEKILDKY